MIPVGMARTRGRAQALEEKISAQYCELQLLVELCSLAKRRACQSQSPFLTDWCGQADAAFKFTFCRTAGVGLEATAQSRSHTGLGTLSDHTVTDAGRRAAAAAAARDVENLK
jgi:hypothetical protein